MLSVVLLSISATFAADDNVDAIAVDEITDEPLTVDEDSQALSDGDVVTKDNFNSYFDSNGTLMSNVTASELTFSGDISDVGVDTIVLNRAISVFGENSTLTNIAIDIKADNVVISGLTINQNNGTYAISAFNATGVEISDSTINFNAVSNADGYAIKADTISNLKLLNNAITYVGSTLYSGINNGILVSNSYDVNIKGNKFNLSLVSAAVAWFEVPTGSGNWVSTTISEGIVVDSSTEVIFEDNIVDLVYNSISGSYDTLYAIDFKDSAYTAISGNTISVSGHTYTYGIITSGFNFVIDDNTIIVESDNYYANGIDIEGPAAGEVKNNVISVNGVQSAYGIYSGMNGQNVSAIYTNNTITGKAYNVFGMSLGDVVSQIDSSYIDLDGNYTTGIAYYGNYINATENRIVLTSSEEGNESIWESFGVETVGIKVVKGAATITNNVIATAGKGVSLTGNETSAYLADNFINVVANTDKDAYAIYCIDTPELYIISNDIDYQGTTQGTGINNAVYINNVNNTMIALNEFNLDLISCYVPWFEIPASSGNWVSFPVSEGIVVDESDNVIFGGNVVNVTYGDIVGSYDTIYAVDFKNSDNALITNNEINSNGYTYIYGIIISGDNFTIESNNITTVSDYYANGIDIEGPAAGIVKENKIDVKANTSAYAIYSGMNGADVKATYTGNEISGAAYNVFGMSLGDVESNIVDNTIALIGNYTTGIAYRGSNLVADNNIIALFSSEEGNESIWEAFGVETVGIKVTMGNASIVNNIISAQGKGVSLSGSEIALTNNAIAVVASADKDAYAIYADSVEKLTVTDNDVGYAGATAGTGINNAVYITNSSNAKINNNKFNLSLVSSYVPWFEIPTGSGNWVSFPVSEGIVIDSSNGVIFQENDVNVDYGAVVGSYDTIYAVDFKNSDDALIKDNNIVANGHTYIYGIIISGENFTIADNEIRSESDNYYANGIDVEGPATGVIFGNEIHATGVQSAYPIYSGMNGQSVSVNYTNNDLYGDAYLVIGMSLGDVESNIVNNCIYVDGNYTKGIAARVAQLSIIDNLIVSLGSNVGNESVWEAFGVDTYGIKVTSGDALIANNTIKSTSDYAIYMASGVTGSISGNDLVANNVGKNAIEVANNITISGTGPDYKTIIIASDLTKAYGASTQFTATLIDENGAAVANKEVILTKGNDVLGVATTNANGIAKFNINLAVGTYTVNTGFDGDNVYAPKDTTNKIVVTKAATKITATKKTCKATTNTKKYTVTVKANNKALAKVKVTIKVNGKTYKATTNSKGKATFKITKLNKKGKYTATVKFAGNGSYKSSSAKAVITVK